MCPPTWPGKATQQFWQAWQHGPGLPPDGMGAVVSLVDVVSDDVRKVLESPQQLLIDPSISSLAPLRAKVHATDHEWWLIVSCCVKTGIMREIPLEDIHRHQGQQSCKYLRQRPT